MHARLAPWRLANLLLVALLISWVGLADAASLRYRVPPSCPDEADFIRAVSSRGGRFDDVSEPQFAVTVAREASGYVGSFQIDSDRGRSDERALRAPSCHEVVDALAVATALALRASSTPSMDDEVAPEAIAPAAPPLTPLPDQREAPPALQVGPAFSLSAFGGLSFGLVPSTPLPRYELALTWASLATQGKSGRIVGPVMRLGLNLYGGATYEMAGSSTKLGAQALTVGPCYAPVYRERGLALLACLDLSAGLVGASSVDRETGRAHRNSIGFGSVGLGLEAEYNLGRHFRLALRGGVSALVAPIAVRGAEGEGLFRSARFNGYLSIGAGGHF